MEKKSIHKGSDTKTAKQWMKEGRLIKEGASGERLWTNGHCQISAVYYNIEDTYEATAEKLKAAREPELAKRREYSKLKREHDKAVRFRNSTIKKSQKIPIIPCDNESKIVVFDVETTGLLPYEDEILQFSACDGFGNTLLNTYIKPYIAKEWSKAECIHGISSEKVADAPYFHELIPTIKGIFESAEILIAYNGDLDMRFLEAAGVDINIKDKEYYDVMEDFAPIFGEWDDYHGNYRWQKLGTCSSYYGYEFTAHDSMEDVKATLHCWKCIHNKN